jgi:MFS family permease
VAVQGLSARTTVLYSVANAGANMVAAFTNAALPLYLLPYGLPGWAVGLLAQERSGVGGLVQPVIGWLSDRTRTRLGKRRPYFLIGAPLTALALAYLTLHPPLVATVLVVAVLAFLLAVANDPYIALLADMVPEEQRGRVGSIQGLFGMLGQVAVLLAAAFLWQSHESLVILGVGAGLVVCFGVTFLGVREPPSGPPPPRSAGPSRSPIAYARDVLGYREVAKYAAAMSAFWCGGGAATPFLTRFGVFELGLDERTSFLLVMLLVLCTGLAAYPAGWLADRIGKKRVMSTGLGFFACAVLIASQARTLEQLIPAIVVVGAANTIPYVLNYPMLADLIPKSRAGEFTGLGSMVWSISQPIGALLAGALVDVSGSYRLAFLFSGVMMIVSFSILRTVHPPTSTSSEAAAIVAAPVAGA